MIDIHPVRGRRDLSRFIDFAYIRNRLDPHWIPPLRIGERERLSVKKNPFFGHAASASGLPCRLFPLGLIRLLRRKTIIDQARLLLLGVLAGYRAHGLYPLLLLELQRQRTGSRYHRIEFSWVLEDNRDINQPAEQAGARRYKTCRVYQKALA